MPIHRRCRPALLAATAALALVGRVAPAAAAPQIKEVAVKGAVTLEVSSFQARLVVKLGAKARVRVVAELAGGILGEHGIELSAHGDTVELDGLDPTVTGTVTIELPAGSRLEADTVHGDIAVSGLAAAELEAVSGALTADGVEQVEAQSVSGKVVVTGGTRHQIETVSGAISVTAASGAPRLEVAAVSGSMKVSGTCGKGCRIQLETLSGAATLVLDRKSSFALEFASFTGKLFDKLGLGLTSEDGVGCTEQRGTLGKGEGRIEIETFSGDVTIQPAGK